MSEKESTPGFTDHDDRWWPVVITDTRGRMLRDELKLDINDTAQAYMQIISEPLLTGMALWIICEPLADKRGVKPDEFGELFHPDVKDEAREAFRAAMELFTPPLHRGKFNELIATAEKVEQEIFAEAAEWMRTTGRDEFLQQSRKSMSEGVFGTKSTS